MSNKVLHVVHWEMSGINEVVKKISSHGKKIGDSHKILCLRKNKNFSDKFLFIARVAYLYFYTLRHNCIVHAHSFLPGLVMMFVFWRPRAFTFHNSYPYLKSFSLKSKLKKIIVKLVLSISRAKISCVSNDTARCVKEGVSINCPVIYNGVDLNEYEYNTPQSIKVVGAAGRLDDQKNFSSLIRAIALLDRSDLMFIIAGDGLKKNELKKMINDNDLQNYVSMIGFVKDMKSFYRSIDAFICTSTYEGFGLVIAEAIASGKPLVSTNVGLVADIKELNVIKIDVYPDAICEGLKKLIHVSEKSILELTENNKKVIDQLLSVDVMYQRYESFMWRQEGRV